MISFHSIFSLSDFIQMRKITSTSELRAEVGVGDGRNILQEMDLFVSMYGN